MIQRGENPDRAKLSSSGKVIQRGESPGKAKLGISGRRECDHDHEVALVRSEKRTRRNPRLLKPMRFRSLHHHSTYSFLDGFQLPAAHVRRATELNMDALAMTEHGNVMSHVKFEKAAKAQGVKPVFGCELYMGKIGKKAEQRKNHLTVLAMDVPGYQNLLQLVSRSYAEGFYYEATVSNEMLAENGEGLIVLSGCQGSLLFTSLIGGKLIDPAEASYKRAKGVARQYQRMFGDRYYIEVQAFPELEATRQANPLLARIARQLGIPLVATMDCHYTVPTEKEIQQVLHNVRGGGKKTLEEQAREWGYVSDLCPPKTDGILLRRLMATGLTRQESINAILNTEEIASRCNVELPKLPMVRYPVRKDQTAVGVWREWLREGWRERGLDRLPQNERRRYRERLKYEMSIIEEKDFVDYFLVVADVVRDTKRNGIAVGPARGSAAASLACWLLRITEVNPMEFRHLVFERFIDLTRADLPDIDLDFDSERRNEIRDYLVAKYGPECVNNIGTFTTYKSRLALDDVARVYQIPKYEVEAIKGVLIERSSGDLRSSATIEDTLGQFDQAQAVVERHPKIMTATELEGNVKGFGIHAAGLVVSNGPITDVTAVLQRKVNGEHRTVVGIDKYDAEELNLLKLDLLGLSTMTMLATACKYVGMEPRELYEIDTTDPEVIQGFKENDVVGVFQFDGRATRSVNGALKPDTFQEVCDITALSRPGPLHNGASQEYIEIKHGRMKPKVLHDALVPITEGTYYQVVYQEQILRIVREIGNFDWTHAAYIRKIISRKLGDQEFNRQWERFYEGAQRLPNMSEETARAIWGLCVTAGSYAFNAAHSVSYGYIAWWTMWFKRHHPQAFYAASLAKMPNITGGSANTKASVTAAAKLDRHSILMRDATQHGLRVRPPHPTKSLGDWRPEGKRTLRAGFTQLGGIGDKTAKLILDHRDEIGMQQWNDLLAIKGIGHKTIAKIKDFVSQEDPFGIFALQKMLDQVKSELPGLGLRTPTHTALEVPYEKGRDEEIIWLGVPVHLNLRDIFEVNRARHGTELDPSEVTRPDLSEWLLIAGYDGTELLTLRIDRFRYPDYRDMVWKMKVNEDCVWVKGIKPGWKSNRELKVVDMKVIEP